MTIVARSLCPLAFALACNFDGTGFGDPPPASAGDTTTAASTGPAPSSSTTDPTTVTPTTDLSTSSATTLPLTSTDPSTSSTSTAPDDDTTGIPDTTTTGDDTTTSSTTSSSTSTTGPASCADVFYKQIVKVDDATTVAPMIKAMSQQQPEEGIVAYSEVAEQGTVSFPIDVPCDGQLYVWGRVRDAKPGTGSDDPDSFYTRVDAGPESSWFYGCQTGGENSSYRWKRVRTGVQGEPCDDNTVWPVSVTAGAHTITLRNREPKSQVGGVAVIARLLVTSDPDASPDPGD